ncbi:hypothetical protein [Sulfobacillus thermosulfidooxidans]|uniref:hypothetical protein n=1 Tax=Sulfobacillus thermosulfidooxidans TaxID=28034 RepID=UPI00042154BB|nr:hypothetical protein [Sulfobacillus thermosulfidooxidans]
MLIITTWLLVRFANGQWFPDPSVLTTLVLAGLGIGITGTVIDGILLYRTVIFERFLIWVTVTFMGLYLVLLVLPQSGLSTVIMAAISLLTALIELLVSSGH